MCSQADDPSQHVSDDTLRVALERLRIVTYTSDGYLEGYSTLSDDIDGKRILAAFAASATEGPTLRAALDLVDEVLTALTAERGGPDSKGYEDQDIEAFRSRRARLAASATDERPERFDRSWSHYADDCPTPPAFAASATEWQDDCMCWHVCPKPLAASATEQDTAQLDWRDSRPGHCPGCDGGHS